MLDVIREDVRPYGILRSLHSNSISTFRNNSSGVIFNILKSEVILN